MKSAHSDETYVAMLRDAAGELRKARAAKQRLIDTQKTALREILAQARDQLAFVDIDAQVHEDTVTLRVHDGEHSVDVSLREGTDQVTVTGANDGATVPIRWMSRASQWVGPEAGALRPSEPAWYSVAKKVVDELAHLAR